MVASADVTFTSSAPPPTEVAIDVFGAAQSAGGSKTATKSITTKDPGEIVVAYFAGPYTLTAVASTPSLTWTLLETTADPSTDYSAYYAVMPTAGALSVAGTFATAGTGSEVVLVAVSGGGSVSSAVSATGNGLTPTVPISTSGAGEMILAFGSATSSDKSTEAITPGPGYTLVGTASTGGGTSLKDYAVEYQVLSENVTGLPADFDLAVASDWAVIAVAISPLGA